MYFIHYLEQYCKHLILKVITWWSLKRVIRKGRNVIGESLHLDNKVNRLVFATWENDAKCVLHAAGYFVLSKDRLRNLSYCNNVIIYLILLRGFSKKRTINTLYTPRTLVLGSKIFIDTDETLTVVCTINIINIKNYFSSNLQLNYQSFLMDRRQSTWKYYNKSRIVTDLPS